MKILIVEDAERIARTLKKGFEQERYIVDIAFDGTSGHDLAVSEKYDVIILDIMLPGMNGHEICASLRKQKNTTPILMLTAKSQTEDIVSGLEVGADDYLTKPFSFEELLARVHALNRRPKETKEPTLQFRDLTLNTTTFRVTRMEKPINLTKKEYSLLEYLISNPNSILTKDQIISHVWDYDSDILPNTVEAYIKKLRDKIDLPYNKLKPLIHTVRGFGYRLGD